MSAFTPEQEARIRAIARQEAKAAFIAARRLQAVRDEVRAPEVQVTRPSWGEELLERCAADDRAAQRSVWKRLQAWLQAGGARRA